jgi:flavodoxin
MKKVIIAYFSTTGKTETMANYIAEGIRFTGNQAVTKKISEIKSSSDLKDYDGYIFGSPTFSLDVPSPMKTLLSKASVSLLKGKLAGAFGAYKHDVGYEPGGKAGSIILDKLQKEFKMEPFELGALRLQEDIVETVEGTRACQDYGKVFGEKLGS